MPEANFSKRQTDIYREGMISNQLPTVTTDPNKLEEQAKRYMTLRGFSFVSGGAGEKSTMAANRLAFRQWKVREAFLVSKIFEKQCIWPRHTLEIEVYPNINSKADSENASPNHPSRFEC